MPDQDPTPSNLPDDQATAAELLKFAGDFDGYRAAGGFHECARIAQAPDLNSITEMRIAMFFAVRAMRHCGDDLEDRELDLFRDYVARIREILAARPTTGESS